jgi:biotin carboxylase
MKNFSKRVLLFTNKLGYQTRSFEDAAKKLSVEIVYVSDRCHKLEDPWGDRAIPVHFETPQTAARTVVETLDGKTVDGIVALGDRPAVSAAYAARHLAIPFHHPSAVEACRSKLRMREVFRDAGQPTPWFRTMAMNPLPEPALLGIAYPCVLKPMSLAASQGVIRANDRLEFNAAAERIRRLLQSPEVRATREPNLDHILVEGYIPGREVAVEALMTEGALRVLAIFDKPDPLEGPYFEESIYVTPSCLPASTQRAIEKCTADCAAAMGLTHGPVHAEFRIRDESIWPLEIAARPIGGLCARALRFLAEDPSGADTQDRAIGMGLEELVLRHALHLPGSHGPRESTASGVMMIPVPSNGILEKIEGEQAAREIQGITELIITARLHDYLAAWPEGSSYLGFLFSKGNSSAEVETALRDAHAQLRFTLTPRLPVQHPTRTVAGN